MIKTKLHSLSESDSKTIWKRIEHDLMPEPNTGCWLWAGLVTSKGYGVMSYKNAHMSLHRVSYIKHKGSIPSGKLVCHSCDQRSCLNPDHLFIGDPQDNTNDMIVKRRARKNNNYSNRSHPSIRPVMAFKDGVHIGNFVSISDASKKLSVSSRNIWSVCKGRRIFAGGYKFKYILNEKTDFDIKTIELIDIAARHGGWENLIKFIHEIKHIKEFV